MQSAIGDDARNQFGTFGGVFTPCVLTILGVIMFLRFGEVVGNAGVFYAILIVLAAKLITTLTAFSLSAIATNTRTEGGGAYFLISRSLGVEFGGTIGLVFFIAQAVSVAMYVIGFSEAFTATFPGVSDSIVVVALVTNAIVFACVYIGAGWTIKVQYLILAVLVASVVVFVLGALRVFDAGMLQENMSPKYSGNRSLVVMFALFFPAVTGIMAGANMSGDLADPARSIPRGTLLAVGVTAIVYLGLAILLGGAASRETLQTEPLVMGRLSPFPWLITAGVFAATLSSALGSMMGSPRILQAFARDRVLPVLNPLAQGSGPRSEPRRATVLTFLISTGCILIGDLNAIAPVITMAFMITYGTLNLATFYEGFTRNPSYRPRFRYTHWTTSLLGAGLCVGVMFLISWLWALVAVAAMFALYLFINTREIEASWGDLRSGLAFERARRNLLVIEDELYHPKNWRPMLLTMSGAAATRSHLAVFGHWLTAGHGIQTLGLVIQGDVSEMLERRSAQRDVLRKFIRESGLSAFPAVVVAPTLDDGIVSLVQCHGLGGLEPNTVMLGWPGDPQRTARFVRTVRLIKELDRSVIVMRSQQGEESVWKPPWGSIDVWWRGRTNGPLLVMLAHLLRSNPGWRHCVIRLLRVVPNEAGRDEVLAHLTELIETSRIDATPQVVVDEDPRAAITRHSRSAAVTLLGFEPPAVDPDADQEAVDSAFVADFESMVESLPRVLIVSSTGNVALES